MTLTPAERVAYGAARLDSHIPLWFTVVEPPSPTDMEVGHRCVAGQLQCLDGETAASVGISCDPRNSRLALPVEVIVFASEWGFNPSISPMPASQQYAELSEAWTAEIVARREEAA